MSGVSGSKRTIEFPPIQAKKAKKEDPGLDDHFSLDVLAASHGVDRIPFAPSVKVHTLGARHLEQVIQEHVVSIGKLGRQVVGLPIILDDGILIHWVRSTSEITPALEPPAKVSIYSSQGDRHARLALHGPHQPRSPVISTKHACANTGSSGPTGTNAEDAIAIDSDVDESEIIFITHRGKPGENQDCSGHFSHNPSKKCEPSVATVSTKAVDNFCSVSDALENQPDLYPHSESVLETTIIGVDLDTTSFGEGDALTFSDTDSLDTNAEDIVVISSDREDVTREGESISEDRDVSEDELAKEIPEGSSHSRVDSHALQTTRIHQDVLTSRQQKRGWFRKSGTLTISTERLPLQSKTRIACATRRQSKIRANGGTDTRPAPPKRVLLPKTHYGRPRRIAIPRSVSLPLVTVTMRGDCHFIHRREKYRMSRLSLPNTDVFRHVEDVCTVDDTVILGCDKGPHQISFLPVSEPHITDARHSPHSNLLHQDTTKRGVSCLAAMHAEAGHIKFVSGGHDGFIHMWSANVEALEDAHSEKVAFHGCSISALAYGHHNATLLSSAQKTMLATDLNHMKSVTNRFSNEIQQIHIHPQAPYMTFFEVRHLDQQILLYDSRKSAFDKEPCLSFGHRSQEARFSPSYTRGSAHLVYFARGDEEGSVFLWDFRNVKDAIVKRRYQQGEKVVHTVFIDSDIATLGGGVVTFFERYLVD